MVDPTNTAVIDREVTTPAEDGTDLSSAPEVVEEELLVEDVSIDGMCGVY